MARNGTGSMVLVAGNPVVTGTVISSTVNNTTMADIANEITNSLPRDGQAPPTANLPMGGYKLTGLANGVAASDSAAFGQIAAALVPYTTTAALTSTTEGSGIDLIGGAIKRVASFSALLALTPTTVTTTLQVALDSYYGDGAAGGGIFQWAGSSTATEDLGTVVCPTARTMAISGATIFTGNGATVTFSGTLPNVPVRPGSVTFTAGTVTATDNSAGTLSGTGVTAGTINYTTGAWSITYSVAPANALVATAAYRYASSAGRWLRVYAGGVDATWFGVKADGVTDDTVRANVWLYRGDKTALIDGATILVSGPLYRGTASNRAMPIRMTGGAQIKPTGTGYTVLTVYGGFFTQGWSIKIDSGATSRSNVLTSVNGIDFINMAGCDVDLVRVNGLDGFGFRAQYNWDSNWHDVSVQLCGNATYYAASWIFAGGANSNHTTVGRLQVEQSWLQALSVENTTQHVNFLNIHSEQAFATSTSVTWNLGGNNCRYGCVRLSASKDATLDGVGTAVFQSAGSSFANVTVESAAGATNTAKFRINGSVAQFDTFTATTLIYDTANGHNSPVLMKNGIVTNATVADIPGTWWDGGSISGTATVQATSQPLTFGSAASSGFRGVSIGTIAENGNAVSSFANCPIATYNGNFAVALFVDCYFPNAVNSQTSNSKYVRGQFHSNLTLNNDAGGVTYLQDCSIAGNLVNTGANNALVNINSKVVGTVTANLLNPPTIGSWTIGERTYRVTPAVGSPKSWVCTASGSPGTWTSEGNL